MTKKQGRTAKLAPFTINDSLADPVQSFRWPFLFGAVLGLLIFTLYASFAFRGVAAWTIGLVYISYDSLLLGFMVVSSRIAVARQEERNRTAPTTGRSAEARRPTLTVL